MRRSVVDPHSILLRSLVVVLLGCSGGPLSHAQTLAAPTASGSPVTGEYNTRPDVQAFIRDMAERHGFEVQTLIGYFAEARHQPRVVSLMTPAPPTARRSWAAYQARVVDPVRVEMGLSFWRANQETLRQASERYGVPEEIIVAIIGVETNYGRVTGTFRVFDTLVTLSFDYPRRAEFFRGELEQFLLWVRENRLEVLAPQGSYAGAIGIPQFLPGSIRRHAVDFNGDGRVDLSRTPADAVGSVGNFLANHGWQRGGPTDFKPDIASGARLEPFLQAGIEPRFLRAELELAGVRSRSPVAADLPMALIEFPNGDRASDYLLAAPNFYVITRYNRSSFYARGVIELARRLRNEQLARAPTRAG